MKQEIIIIITLKILRILFYNQTNSHIVKIFIGFLGLSLKKTIIDQIKEMIKALTNRNIGTRPFFWPMHKQDAFKNRGYFKNVNLPNSEFIAKNGFYLPSGLGLTSVELKFVKDAVISILKQKIRIILRYLLNKI